MSYLGLPPVPPDLKSITPYLQRAHETRKEDPIISYWCAYYAAQAGITLKAVSPSNRTFLGALLTTLESLRTVVGSSDAITVESASSAYVENFATRVFASADNEDRRGAATRITAKKFLAAATFFDVLNVFEDRGPWEAHEEKIRYAKWRAADIAKALREGRQPTPVSTGEEPVVEAAAIESMSAPPIPPTELIDAPTTHISHELDGAYSTSPALPLVSTAFGENDAPLEIDPSSAPISIDANDAHTQHDLLDGPPEMPPLPTLSHGSPTVPVPTTRIGQGEEYGSPASIIDAPPTTPSPTRTHHSASPTDFLSPSSPPPTSYIAENLYPSAPPLPPPPPSIPYVRMPPPAPPPLEPSPPAELTPGLIAKAQKHSRFAISALDYEDVEQARKELRAALAILGG